jgi:hypothetical protein
MKRQQNCCEQQITEIDAICFCWFESARSAALSLIEVDMAAIGPFRVPFAGYALIK